MREPASLDVPECDHAVAAPAHELAPIRGEVHLCGWVDSWHGPHQLTASGEDSQPIPRAGDSFPSGENAAPTQPGPPSSVLTSLPVVDQRSISPFSFPAASSV